MSTPSPRQQRYLQQFEVEIDAAKLANRPELLKDAVNAGAQVVDGAARVNVQKRGLIRTGYLLNAMFVEVVETGKTYAEAEIGNSAVYAAIHEYGGVIRPRRARALVFQIDGQWVMVGAVTMPARPFLRPALDDNHGGIMQAVGQSLLEGLLP